MISSEPNDTGAEDNSLVNRATISVIIPTFNSGSLVVDAIRSAISQTLTPTEVIVVDDGSTDDTQDRLRELADHIIALRQNNSGVAAARNAGVSRATGEFVAFLDADDIWHPRKLELQIRSLGTSSLGALGTQTFEWPREAPPDLGNVASLSASTEDVLWESLVVKNRLTTSSMLVRRGVLLQAGTFDTGLQGPEDHDLWLRIAEIAPVAVLPLPLTGYRDAVGSLSKHANKMEQGMTRILQKLDRRNVWRGRWLLRRAARGYASYSCAYMYAAAGDSNVALGRLVRSFAWHPLPYKRGTMVSSLARLRLMAALLLDITGVQPSRFSVGAGLCVDTSKKYSDFRSLGASRTQGNIRAFTLVQHLGAWSGWKTPADCLFIATHLLLLVLPRIRRGAAVQGLLPQLRPQRPHRRLHSLGAGSRRYHHRR